MTRPEIAVEPPDSPAGVTGPATAVEATSRSRRRQEPITCSGCSARWTGQGRAHCAAAGCHRSFATANLFDRHRRAFACVDPATIDGMREVDGIWRGPEPTDEQRARIWGAS